MLLFVFYLSESITKIFYLSEASFYNYSALVKGAFIVFSLVYSFRYLTKEKVRLVYFLIIFGLIFLIGQFFFNSFSFGVHFYENLVYFSRYLFIFIILLYFSDYQFLDENPIHLKVYEAIVLINSFLIIIGLVLDLRVFQTYGSNRFGYSGLFMVPSVTTFFYALALTYFTNEFLLKREKLFQLLFIILICFFVGTKALLLFLFLTLFHIFLTKKLYKRVVPYATALFLAVLVLINYQSLKSYLIDKYEPLYLLYTKYDLITMLTSYRNIKLKETFIPLIKEKWSFINYLFGGTDFEEFRVEFEIFDVFLFWGLLGSVLYLYLYFRQVIKFKNLKLFGKVQIIFLLIIAMLSGTYFNNAPIALYLFVVISTLNYKYKFHLK